MCIVKKVAEEVWAVIASHQLTTDQRLEALSIVMASFLNIMMKELPEPELIPAVERFHKIMTNAGKIERESTEGE